MARAHMLADEDGLSLIERLRAVLASRGVATSAQLQQTLGKSQPTLSRALRTLSSEVVLLGRQRSARYALVQPILGLDGQQPLWWTDEQGQDHPFGTLTYLGQGRLHVQAEGIDLMTHGALPWFLAPLRLQGFLGRQWARGRAAAGYDANPERWRVDQLLALLVQEMLDFPGAIGLGDMALGRLAGDKVHSAPYDPEGRAAHFDALAADATRTLPKGSSAAGEQPKFITGNTLSGEHLLVKFSPPRGTPFGERWHDLLHAESLALRTLAAHDVPVARTQMLETSSRTYLVSHRFDQVGSRGRRHVVPLDAVHDAFVPGPRRHWAASCSALVGQRRLPAGSDNQAAALLAFGRLIGNTDMHFGNLSVQVVSPADVARGRFTLAPVYDMLPMRWRPDLATGELDLLPFTPEPADLITAARRVALEFWERAAACAGLSPGFRKLAGAMALQLE